MYLICFAAAQANRVASPVPAFDCSSRTWARPTLERAEIPFIRGSQGSGPLDFAEWGSMLRSSQLGTSFLVSDNSAPAARRGTVTTVTDEGLLDHLTTDVLEEQQQFVKARSTSSPDKRHTAFVPRAIANGGEAETVLRTDHNGRVVEVRDAFRYVQASLCCVSLVSRKAQVFAWGRLAARALSVFRSVSVFVFVCVCLCVCASERARWTDAASLLGRSLFRRLGRGYPPPGIRDWSSTEAPPGAGRVI